MHLRGPLRLRKLLLDLLASTDVRTALVEVVVVQERQPPADEVGSPQSLARSERLVWTRRDKWWLPRIVSSKDRGKHGS